MTKLKTILTHSSQQGKKAVEEINEKFGLEIEVDINQNYVKRMKEKS